MSTLLLTLALAQTCLLGAPVSGPVLAPFAPVGSYGGHWGIDLGVPVGTAVRASAPGTVTFAGDVAGVLSVTVNHGGVVRTSYSYLSAIRVAIGDRVARGAVVGLSGIDHGRPAVHWSLRLGDRYLDPGRGCRITTRPGSGVRLAGTLWAAASYPLLRATRHSRRNLRSAPRRPPHRR